MDGLPPAPSGPPGISLQGQSASALGLSRPSAADQLLLDLQATFHQQQPQPGTVQVQPWSGALAHAAKPNASCTPYPMQPPLAAPFASPTNSTSSSPYFNQQHTPVPTPHSVQTVVVGKQARSAALSAVESVMGEGFASSLSHLPPGALELLCSGGVVQERAMGYQATCNVQPVGIKVRSSLPRAPPLQDQGVSANLGSVHGVFFHC